MRLGLCSYASGKLSMKGDVVQQFDRFQIQVRGRPDGSQLPNLERHGNKCGPSRRETKRVAALPGSRALAVATPLQHCQAPLRRWGVDHLADWSRSVSGTKGHSKEHDATIKSSPVVSFEERCFSWGGSRPGCRWAVTGSSTSTFGLSGLESYSNRP